jgi:hypothetical protein
VAGAQHLDDPLFALVDGCQPERQRDAVLEDCVDDGVMGARDSLQFAGVSSRARSAASSASVNDSVPTTATSSP